MNTNQSIGTAALLPLDHNLPEVEFSITPPVSPVGMDKESIEEVTTDIEKAKGQAIGVWYTFAESWTRASGEQIVSDYGTAHRDCVDSSRGVWRPRLVMVPSNVLARLKTLHLNEDMKVELISYIEQVYKVQFLTCAAMRNTSIFFFSHYIDLG